MPSLPESAGVLVIGGGVIGTSIAFHLAEAGVDVVLLERASLAGGSTVKAAGGVRAQFSDPVNIALGARSLQAFERFGARPGQDIDLRQVGYLFLLTDPTQMDDYEQAVALQRSMGVETGWLTAEQAQLLSPAIRTDDVLAATFHGRDGHCTPESVVLGYARAARRAGAVIATGVDALCIEMSGGEIIGVEHSEGRISTGIVVCAAGAWSRSIAASAGVGLPVEPLKRQILVTEPVPERLAPLLPDTCPMTIDASSTFYFHREGPAVLLGMSYAGELPGFDLLMSDDWLPDLGQAMERCAPALAEVGIAHGWAGLYEMTPDHNALIGEASAASRLLYATGFSGHGFLQAPAVGEVLRDLVLGREPVIDVSPLSADRFLLGSERTELNIV